MTYQYLEDSDLDPGSPGNTSLFSRLARNPDAIAKGEPGAPVVVAGWHPYDMVEVGDGNDGAFYDAAVDGSVTTVYSPSFETGYEYAIYSVDLVLSSSFGPDIWVERSDGSDVKVLDQGDGEFLIFTEHFPTKLRSNYTWGGTVGTLVNDIRFKIASSGGGSSISGGKIHLLRRREYVTG